MRTIKFKAKRQDNGQWVTGDLAHSLDGKLNILRFVEEGGILGFTGAYPIVPDTICQFIGFIDRTRKEIYEGDLLWDRSINGCFYRKSTGYCGVVVWNSHEAYYELKAIRMFDLATNDNLDGISEPISQDFLRDFEVFGSIHDPEWQQKLKLTRNIV